jgi:hypothetical protein
VELFFAKEKSKAQRIFLMVEVAKKNRFKLTLNVFIKQASAINLFGQRTEAFERLLSN